MRDSGGSRAAESRRQWARARDRLALSVTGLGFPEEFADLLARQLGSPGAMDWMAGYLDQARPASVEMIVEEMLAIRAEIDAWREKKESREAQAAYNAWMRSGARLRNMEEDAD